VTWYLSEYDDITKEPYWSANSALHHLLHGANLGGDPNSWFNSQWYLLTNPDVATQEMTPIFDMPGSSLVFCMSPILNYCYLFISSL
jgi:hypothetical protein